jgi:isoaspartyl peptidase/L-asparaginase-like protein (Ntn-hydrolase superfamily)
MDVLVHGGAMEAPEEPIPRQETLDRAARRGGAAETPVDAVEEAIRTLESAPRFNAGLGGAVQSDGTPRCDAGLMQSDRSIGAVCSMEGVEHAVSAARVVLEETPHVLLSGDHAVQLAGEFGVETGLDLWTDESRDRWEAVEDYPDGTPSLQLAWVGRQFGGSDTVGAVATDGERLAAATSTGGRWFALAGRVGDVPQAGSGFYANARGAASATGAGEDIARMTLSRQAVDFLDTEATAQAAAERAIAEFADVTGSHAGIIVISPDGDRGNATNAEEMQTATAPGE